MLTTGETSRGFLWRRKWNSGLYNNNNNNMVPISLVRVLTLQCTFTIIIIIIYLQVGCRPLTVVIIHIYECEIRI
jgi:hypothetical protein